jgi:maltose/maltodextrin transport system substrate-binding protein
MDADRSQGLAPIAKKFESDFGIKVKIETPEKITDSFPIAAQAWKGPDIVIWAHDKLGEWADGGLIAPVEVSDELVKEILPEILAGCVSPQMDLRISDRLGDYNSNV